MLSHVIVKGKVATAFYIGKGECGVGTRLYWQTQRAYGRLSGRCRNAAFACASLSGTGNELKTGRYLQYIILLFALLKNIISGNKFPLGY